nr:MAG TPA: hypothetical protein [Caudoviricetes sp.]
MSLPVVVHFNQRFCLFFNTDRLLNDQVQQVRHLNNDVIRRVLGVINEPLMNAIVTKMSASMGRSGNSFRKSEGVDTASQGSCRNTPVFTEPLKGVTKQSGGRRRRFYCNALRLIPNVFNRLGHVLGGGNRIGFRPNEFSVNPKAEFLAVNTLFDTDHFHRKERGKHFNTDFSIEVMFSEKVFVVLRFLDALWNRNGNLLSNDVASGALTRFNLSKTI